MTRGLIYAATARIEKYVVIRNPAFIRVFNAGFAVSASPSAPEHPALNVDRVVVVFPLRFEKVREVLESFGEHDYLNNPATVTEPADANQDLSALMWNVICRKSGFRFPSGKRGAL